MVLVAVVAFLPGMLLAASMQRGRDPGECSDVRIVEREPEAGGAAPAPGSSGICAAPTDSLPVTLAGGAVASAGSVAVLLAVASAGGRRGGHRDPQGIA
ncbi:MAG TPA: hypothetical protein VF230_05820 [Acidimicrobiales bacterium]